jgi:hypothetical protein
MTRTRPGVIPVGRHPLFKDQEFGWMCLRHGGCWLARIVRHLIGRKRTQ